MARCIAISNQKGGVSKTTTAINLGAALAEAGHSVLLIDLDPQAGMTTSLGYFPDDLDEHSTMYHVLNGSVSLSEATRATKMAQMDFVPSTMELAAYESENGLESGWQHQLSNILSRADSKYDYILIDCPPSLGKLTVTALVASQMVIVPVQTDFLALVGTRHLIAIMEDLRSDANPDLDARFLRTMHDRRTAHSREVLWETVDSLDAVLETVIPYTVRFKDATVSGEPILLYDANHKASRAFRQLTKEILTIFENG